MRVRIRFEKTGIMRYVGHLDLMRFFQKAVKRSGIPIRYSEGFNPHQIMSFAAPLGVGLTSSGEYMDIDIKEYVDPVWAREALDKNMVEGLHIVSFKYLPDNAVKCMSAVTAASYRVTYKDSFDPICNQTNLAEKKIAFFDNAQAINIVKETKKGSREIDLKPLIYSFDIDFKDKLPVYHLLLSSGSADNIKPELVISAFHDYLGLATCDRLTLDIHRCDMLTGPADALVSLGDIGNDNI